MPKMKVTKKSLLEQCSAILKKYSPGERIGSQDESFMLDILPSHHEWDEKSYPGVAFVFVDKDGWGGKCFWLMRIDGTVADISFRTAINGPATKRAEVLAAMREAVMPQIRAVKNSVKFGVDTCPFTGEALTAENTHIDHYDMKFADLAAAWLSGKDLDALHGAVRSDSSKSSTVTKFSDQAIAVDFACFHAANTNLRAVSAYANLKILR